MVEDWQGDCLMDCLMVEDCLMVGAMSDGGGLAG